MKPFLAPATIRHVPWAKDIAQFDNLLATFKHYGDQYKIDSLLLTAQGYQESQLDQTKRSPFGAVGIMQLLLSTGREVGVASIDREADANIPAGAAYLRPRCRRVLRPQAVRFGTGAG